MNIKSQKDFISGLLFMGVGVSFAWNASGYTIGNAARMGAGYFPLVLGVVLAVLGGVITFKALVVETVDGERLTDFAWRPLVLIILANLVFGAMMGGLPSLHVPPMGLIAAVLALTLLCCWAGSGFSLREAIVLAALLAGISYFACITVLQLRLPVWPPFVAT